MINETTAMMTRTAVPATIPPIMAPSDPATPSYSEELIFGVANVARFIALVVLLVTFAVPGTNRSIHRPMCMLKIKGFVDMPYLRDGGEYSL
jgi:hypothetical protein